MQSSTPATRWSCGTKRVGKTRGRVVSISGEEVVVTRRRRFFGFFRSPEELVFGADSITRVDIVDSTRNGTLQGLAVGAGLSVGLGIGSSTDE